jgi:hypothetical protein
MHLSVDAMRIRYFPHIGFDAQAHSTYFLNKMKMFTMGVVDEGSERGVNYVWDNVHGSTACVHVLSSIWRYIQSYGRGERKL